MEKQVIININSAEALEVLLNENPEAVASIREKVVKELLTNSYAKVIDQEERKSIRDSILKDVYNDQRKNSWSREFRPEFKRMIKDMIIGFYNEIMTEQKENIEKELEAFKKEMMTLFRQNSGEVREEFLKKIDNFIVNKKDDFINESIDKRAKKKLGELWVEFGKNFE